MNEECAGFIYTLALVVRCPPNIPSSAKVTAPTMADEFSSGLLEPFASL